MHRGNRKAANQLSGARKTSHREQNGAIRAESAQASETDSLHCSMDVEQLKKKYIEMQGRLVFSLAT
jgi:hypothetical protein